MIILFLFYFCFWIQNRIRPKMSRTIHYKLCLDDIHQAIAEVTNMITDMDDVIDMDRYTFNNQDDGSSINAKYCRKN